MLSLFMPKFLASTPSAISNWWYGTAVQPTAAGIMINESVAMTYSAVWACTRVLSASGSCLPLNMYERVGQNTNIATQHAAHRLIHKEPNKEMGSMGFRSIGLMRQVNLGNFFAEIVRDPRGTPDALWPIDNDKVQALRPSVEFASHHNLEPHRLAWQVRQEDGTNIYIKDANMFNVRSMISDDGIIGQGVIANARETIAHGIATVRQGAAYMKNSSRPSVVISGGRYKDAEDREAFRRTWMSVHGGPENNAKPAMLPEGASIDKLSFSPEDSQFLQTMQFTVEDIARFYGVQPHMIQHLLRATYSNVEAQGIDFVKYSLIPWLKMWEEEINRKLLTPVERATYYSKHNVTSLLRGDTEARAKYYQAMWQLGTYSINEIRGLEDMNPIDDGDQHFVQTSYTTIDRIGEVQDGKVKVDMMSVENAGLKARIDAMSSTPDPLPVVAETKPFDIITNIQSAPVEPRDKEFATLMALMAERMSQTRQTDVEAQLSSIQEAASMTATIAIADAVSRMLVREITSVERALSKEPSEFFAWCDEFYESHTEHLCEALKRPVHAHAAANNKSVDNDALASEIACAVMSQAKEDVLALTACQPDEWSKLPERFGELSAKWRVERSEQCIAMVSDAKETTHEAEVLTAVKALAERPVNINIETQPGEQGLAGMPGQTGPPGPRGEDGRDGREGQKGDRGEAVTPEITVVPPAPSKVTFNRDADGNIIDAERE